MKKYYIPTSTLNFNNILSSESISPKAFYYKRNFGYQRWQEIEENDIDNAILLYEQPFSFTRPESDVEDHPLLIEISTDEVFPICGAGTYYCDHTLYLSPWHTRFIFFTPQDKRVALSISDSSLETKMLELYRRNMVEEWYQQRSITPPNLNIPLNIDAIEADWRINKMKGLLYGYYLGAMLSTSTENVEQANILQELQNVFSAVLASESHTPTLYQQQKLSELFQKKVRHNPIISYLLNVLKENQNPLEVVNNLSRLGARFPSMVNQDTIVGWLAYAKDDYNPAMDWLKQEQNNLKKQIFAERNPLSVSLKEIVVANRALATIQNENLMSEMERHLVIVWVNDILVSKEYNGKVTTFMESLSDVVTRKAKDVYGSEWEGSNIKQQLNQMRRYVRAQEANMVWNNDIVAALTAVLAKGSDWNQLHNFMQSKAMTDYRLPFAFYGIMNGFANLTRDFTDILLNLKDDKGRLYKAEVYREIYKQLHETDPSIGGLPLLNADNNTILDIDKSKCLQSDSEDQLFDKHFWEKPIREFAEKELGKNEKKKRMLSLDEAFTHYWNIAGSNPDMKDFLKILADYDGWKTTKGRPNAYWNRMQEHFVPDYFEQGKNESQQQSKSNTSRAVQQDIFASPISFDVTNTVAIIEAISDLFPNSQRDEIARNVKKDLEWILDPNYSGEKAVGELIQDFKKRLTDGKTLPKGTKGGSMEWKNKLYKDLDIDLIIKRVEERCINK